MGCLSDAYAQFQWLKLMNSTFFVTGGSPPNNSFAASFDAVSALSKSFNRQAVISKAEKKYRELEPKIIEHLGIASRKGVLVGIRIHEYAGGRAAAFGTVFIAATGKTPEEAVEIYRNGAHLFSCTSGGANVCGHGWKSRTSFLWVSAIC